jgi:hypothetical protein
MSAIIALMLEKYARFRAMVVKRVIDVDDWFLDSSRIIVYFSTMTLPLRMKVMTVYREQPNNTSTDHRAPSGEVCLFAPPSLVDRLFFLYF